jgi:hypothetical protein
VTSSEPRWRMGQAVRWLREPELGRGRITGVIRTRKPDGDHWTYMAQFPSEPGRWPPCRLGEAEDFSDR